ncbi:hypothetical protein ABFX02_13G022800 [Erythranthe guttata]
MVRAPRFDKNGMKKGVWSEEEDNKLRAYIHRYGHPNWRLLPVFAGLARCGKSCRLRWVNYLKPGLKRGKFTEDEEDLIIKLHDQLGTKWSAIAAKLPGRTDNEVKNYWHAHINKRNKRNGTTITKEQSVSELEEHVSEDVFAQDLSVENPKNFDDLNTFVDSFLADKVSGDFWTDIYYQTCFGQSFGEEETRDFGLVHQEMQNVNKPTCSGSSDSGITTSWGSAEESRENFWSEPLLEDDIFDMVLW